MPPVNLKIMRKGIPHTIGVSSSCVCLKNLEHYLYGVHCDICTNHETLKYLFTQNELNVRQERWLDLLTDYDFDIHYYLGKANRVADALSRKSTGTPMAIQGLPG